MGKLIENNRPTSHAYALLIFATCVFCLALSLMALPGVLRRGAVQIDVLLTVIALFLPSVYGVYRYAASRDFDDAFCWL